MKTLFEKLCPRSRDLKIDKLFLKNSVLDLGTLLKEYIEKMGFLFRALTCSKSSFLTLQRSLLDSNRKLLAVRDIGGKTCF